jgi:hypothetical protein
MPYAVKYRDSSPNRFSEAAAFSAREAMLASGGLVGNMGEDLLGGSRLSLPGAVEVNPEKAAVVSEALCLMTWTPGLLSDVVGEDWCVFPVAEAQHRLKKSEAGQQLPSHGRY